MASLSAPPDVVARNLAAVRVRVDAACVRAARAPDAVTLCVASKYVEPGGMAALRDAGARVVGENRLQDLIAKQAQFRGDFEWHFIGAIQSRKVDEIARRSSVVHSLATERARDRLNVYDGPLPRILVQVNTGGEESKEGVHPEGLADYLAACEFPVTGLGTMPPLSVDPEAVRPYFRKLVQLAAEHGLAELSMGTSQDFEIAVEEGATLIRVGSALFTP